MVEGILFAFDVFGDVKAPPGRSQLDIRQIRSSVSVNFEGKRTPVLTPREIGPPKAGWASSTV